MDPSFRAERISRLMRMKGADWALGFGSAICALILLLSAHTESPFVFRPIDSLALGLSLLCGLSGWFGVRSWRKLWRRGRTRPERLVYDYGVRGWGVMILIATPLIVAFVLLGESHSLRDRYTWRIVITSVVIVVPIALPLCLWGGYAWGLLVGGKSRDPLAEPSGENQDELPPAA